LIRDGAKLVETAQDVLVELAPQLQAAISTAETEAEPDIDSGEELLDEEYRHLLACLDEAPSSVDQLVTRSGLTADAVSSMLLLLELQGRVIATAGGYTVAGKRL
jgi:DNA processing protein